VASAIARAAYSLGTPAGVCPLPGHPPWHARREKLVFPRKFSPPKIFLRLSHTVCIRDLPPSFTVRFVLGKGPSGPPIRSLFNRNRQPGDYHGRAAALLFHG
jgi:hypothetical protein